MGKLNNVELIFSKLDDRLTQQDYFIVENEYHEEVFGSRFCIWINRIEGKGFRLIWEGKESWFALEESPFLSNETNFTWVHIGVFSLSIKNTEKKCEDEIVNKILEYFK